jgi:hypothetical protein
MSLNTQDGKVPDNQRDRPWALPEIWETREVALRILYLLQKKCLYQEPGRIDFYPLE